MNRIYVINYRDLEPANATTINTTSRSGDWGKGLSPFILGPVIMPGQNNRIAKNVENAWQYSKVFEEHLTDDWPNEHWFKWANEGFNNYRAVRYPMGKGAKPEYSFWNGERLNFTEARREIYLPMYKQAVEKTEAFQKLKEIYDQGDVALRDFDGYRHDLLGMDYEDVINSEKTLGHSFVLAMLLEGKL